MLAVVKAKAEPGVTIKQIPIPKPDPGELLIKVKSASICGTDIAIYDWTPWAESHILPPVVIGHEVLGEVLEINGPADKIKVGDLISSETHIFCGECYQCKIGENNVCTNEAILGISIDGIFAEYVKIPAKNLWKVDSQKVRPEIAAIYDPFGNAVHAVQLSWRRA